MTYTVKPGDSLSIIARDVLGDITLWPKIQQLNNIADPDLIFPGQVLQLPEVGSTTTASATNTPSQPTQTAGMGWVGGLLLLLLIGGAIYMESKKK